MSTLLCWFQRAERRCSSSVTWDSSTRRGGNWASAIDSNVSKRSWPASTELSSVCHDVCLCLWVL